MSHVPGKTRTVFSYGMNFDRYDVQTDIPILEFAGSKIRGRSVRKGVVGQLQVRGILEKKAKVKPGQMLTNPRKVLFFYVYSSAMTTYLFPSS